jgi:transglutaminase-like putative cysteine protease
MDSGHPDVIRFADRSVEGLGGTSSPGGGGSDEGEGQGSGGGHREKAVALYYAVRDQVRYDPYRIDLRPDAMRASATLARGHGFCVAKAVLLGAAARVHGIPSRLGFADVRNHLTTERLRRSMGTDVFVYHGYADLFLDGRWVKATPAFDRALCRRFGVPTLDFDGVHDSVFQPFDGEGNQYMEYLEDHGRFAELPLDDLREAFEAAYPKLMSEGRCDLSGRFEDDAVAER